MDFNIFNAGLKVAAFWAAFIPLLYTLIQSHWKRLQHLAFATLAFGTVCQAFFSIGREFFQVFLTEEQGPGTLFVFEQMYTFAHIFFQVAFAFYLAVVSGFLSKSNKGRIIMFWLPAIIVEIVFLLNPISHFFFDFMWNPETGRYVYVQYFGYHLMWALGICYYSMALISFFKNISGVKWRKNVGLAIMGGIIMLGMIIENTNQNFQIQVLLESFAVLCALIWIDSDESLIHTGTGLYNRVAFLDDNKLLMNTKQRYTVFAISLLNHDQINRFYNEEVRRKLCCVIAEELTKIAKESLTYYLYNGRYAFFFYKKGEEEENKMIETVRKTIDHKYKIQPGIEVTTSWQISVAHVPNDLDDLPSLDDLFGASSNSRGVTIRRGSDLSSIKRRNQILNAFDKGLKDNNFEVYFQPVYSVKSDRIVGAEALIRLNDPLIGKIPPSEFIPIAEASGDIKALGEFVFRETIKFFEEQKKEEVRIDYVSINVSVKQLQRDDLAKYFIETIKERDVDPSNIIIEITESEDAGNSDFFHSQLSALRNAGFLLSLDDYGTGYSNLARVIRSDFTSVKIDRSLLLNAEDKKGKKLLENTIKTMLFYDYVVVQEGVETMEQLNEVARYGVGYIQGFLFSPPIPKESLIRYVKEFKGLK